MHTALMITLKVNYSLKTVQNFGVHERLLFDFNIMYVGTFHLVLRKLPVTPLNTTLPAFHSATDIQRLPPSFSSSPATESLATRYTN